LVAASNSSSANTSALLTIESGPSAFVGQLPSSAFASMSAMATLTASLSTTICKAVLVAVHEESAPLSAWPGEYPGPWATAARVGEIVGCSSAQVSYRLHELVEAGDLVCASPWPGGSRGYQPAGSWTDEPPLFALPKLVADERQWMLDELRRWASLHGGQAPRQKEWSKENDPKRGWPRWDRVAELFEGEALDNGVRYWVDERCALDCACSAGRHYTNSTGEVFCDGCFDCRGHCPHGNVGHWVGPSGWRYALQLAGLDVRTGGRLSAGDQRRRSLQQA
jgi:hypothetical protein